MYKKYSALILLFFLLCFINCSDANSAPVTVFVPSETAIEKHKTKPKPPLEVDILFALMNPAANQSLDMDRPQLFAEIYYPQKTITEELKSERKDLLGDVEEIRYLDKKAWGANVSVENPGLYQFVLESKPWWDDSEKIFRQHLAKVMLPVQNVTNGWDAPAGMNFEILPLNSPFGLTPPALFNGLLLLNGKPCENTYIYMGRINTSKPEATDMPKYMEAKTDQNGRFSFLLTQPGWWYCEAQTKADPLKGPDGQPATMLQSAILWLYVDAPANEKNKK